MTSSRERKRDSERARRMHARVPRYVQWTRVAHVTRQSLMDA